MDELELANTFDRQRPQLGPVVGRFGHCSVAMLKA